MREYHDKCGDETSNSVFSSVELEIRAIISFKVINWYGVTPGENKALFSPGNTLIKC